MFILSHCCQSPFPCWESQSTLPPWMPSNTVLVSGPAVGAAQILIWSYSCVFLPPMSKAIRTSVFSFVGALSVLYTFHRHRVCLVDCVDLICSLYKWWECSRSSSLSTLALGFNCGFTFTSACGSLTGVCSWGCPGGCGSALVRARCGQVWMRYRGLGYRGSGSTRYSREFWAMVVGNIVLYKGMATSISQHTPYCLENPPDKEAWQATVHTVLKSWTRLKWPWSDPDGHWSTWIDARLFLPVASLPQWGLSVKVVQLFGLQGPWWCQVCKDTDCLHHRSYGRFRVFFQASCSWWSEGLFGQSFSIALPVQALRGLLCVGSFSDVWCIRHIEGPPRLGSYCVDRRVKQLKDYAGRGPTP